MAERVVPRTGALSSLSSITRRWRRGARAPCELERARFSDVCSCAAGEHAAAQRIRTKTGRRLTNHAHFPAVFRFHSDLWRTLRRVGGAFSRVARQGDGARDLAPSCTGATRAAKTKQPRPPDQSCFAEYVMTSDIRVRCTKPKPATPDCRPLNRSPDRPLTPPRVQPNRQPAQSRPPLAQSHFRADNFLLRLALLLTGLNGGLLARGALLRLALLLTGLNGRLLASGTLLCLPTTRSCLPG
jgi:hypothetical protein